MLTRRSIPRNLDAADTIAKLVLASGTILLFAVGLIAGPFAVALVILSVFLLLLYVTRIMLRIRRAKKNRDFNDGPASPNSISNDHAG